MPALESFKKLRGYADGLVVRLQDHVDAALSPALALLNGLGLSKGSLTLAGPIVARALTATTATFTGAVTGVSAAFAGTVSAASAAFTGSVVAASGYVVFVGPMVFWSTASNTGGLMQYTVQNGVTNVVGSDTFEIPFNQPGSLVQVCGKVTCNQTCLIAVTVLKNNVALAMFDVPVVANVPKGVLRAYVRNVHTFTTADALSVRLASSVTNTNLYGMIQLGVTQ